MVHCPPRSAAALTRAYKPGSPTVMATKIDLPADSAAIMLEAELRGRIDGEVRFDRTSRMLYSTDASNYQIEPVGVVIPRHADDVYAAHELAGKYSISILPP